MPPPHPAESPKLEPALVRYRFGRTLQARPLPGRPSPPSPTSEPTQDPMVTAVCGACVTELLRQRARAASRLGWRQRASIAPTATSPRAPPAAVPSPTAPSAPCRRVPTPPRARRADTALRRSSTNSGLVVSPPGASPRHRSGPSGAGDRPGCGVGGGGCLLPVARCRRSLRLLHGYRPATPNVERRPGSGQVSPA